MEHNYLIGDNINYGSFIHINSLFLNVSQQCNLRCRYCFATGSIGAAPGRQGTFGEETLMTKEVGRESINFLIQESNQEKEISIVFFGGEPLINFKVIKDIVNYSSKIAAEHNKQINFELDTNGILLNDEIIDFIIKNNFRVQVSIDGPKRIHDKFRCFPNGSGSHDLVIPTVKKLLAAYKEKENISARFVITKHGTKLTNIINYLLKLGFESINFDPVITKESGDILTEKDFDYLNEELTKYAKLFLKFALRGKCLNTGRFLTIIKFFYDRESRRDLKNVYFCGAGRSLLGVSAKGDIYPCASYIGLNLFNLGNVFSGIDLSKLREYLAMTHVDNKSNCSRCWAKYMCGGGCSHESLVMNGDIRITYERSCKFRRYRWKMGHQVYKSILEKDSGIFNQIFYYPEFKRLKKQLLDAFLKAN